MTLRNIVFLGPPGCGKGTYAKLVCKTLKLPHISTGDALRQAVAEGTAVGRQAQRYTERGDQVPQTLMQSVVAELIRGQDDGYLLDGYPRSLKQAEHLASISAVDRVVHITMREDLLERKLAGRRVCGDCGISWNIENVDEDDIKMPPLLPTNVEGCGDCEAKWFQRPDDTLDVIRHRQQQYRELEAPLLNFYTTAGVVHRVDIKGDRDMMLPVFLDAIAGDRGGGGRSP